MYERLRGKCMLRRYNILLFTMERSFSKRLGIILSEPRPSFCGVPPSLSRGTQSVSDLLYVSHSFWLLLLIFPSPRPCSGPPGRDPMESWEEEEYWLDRRGRSGRLSCPQHCCETKAPKDACFVNAAVYKGSRGAASGSRSEMQISRPPRTR